MNRGDNSDPLPQPRLGERTTVTLRFEVFGRHVVVLNKEGRWTAYYQGSEGKRRLATDIVVPSSVDESEVEQYLADLCHEWASRKYPDVNRLD